jgi:hypothetical protein
VFQVIAVDQFEQRILKETSLMRKSPQECSHVLGPILQNSILAEKFSDKFFASNLRQTET